MAHQAHNIPWTLLASHLKYSQPSPYNITNLYPRMLPNQGKDITFFITAFARNIKEHSTCERRKFLEHYDAPGPTDIIVDEKTAARIEPTIRRVKETLGGDIKDIDQRCTTSLFLTAYEPTPCYSFLDFHSRGFFNLQVIEALLLHGEMDPILRGCAHPDVAIESWREAQECYCGGNSVGWELLYKNALTAYLCLNLLYCFPELWDLESSNAGEKKDYRDTRLYQYTVRNCTRSHGKADLVTIPHRQFFGIPDDYWDTRDFFVKNEAHWLWASPHTNKYGYAKADPGLYGMVPFREFLSLEKRPSEETSYLPKESDAALVRDCLYQLGLPAELALDIIELAEYEPRRRLKVEHDPLHLENREELGKYLKFCWQILVRCDLMANEVGMEIPWHDTIGKCLVGFLNYKDCKWDSRWFKKHFEEDYTWTYVFP
ncbi:hypothetical protein BJX64DRAFT_85219 [Aspergillus heterothallicus]